MTALIRREVVDNTNAEAKRVRRYEGIESFFLTAEKQTDAKIRYDRKWIIPRENIALTLAIPCPEGCTTLLPFYLVSQDIIRRTLGYFIQGRGVSIRSKWPNDILVDGKKISATLVEYDQGTIFIGININYKIWGKNVGCPATDVARYGVPCQIQDIIDSLVMNLNPKLSIFKNSELNDLDICIYESRMYGIREDIEIYLNADKSQKQSGFCMGVDSKGQILLTDSYGEIIPWGIDDAILNTKC